MLALGLRGGQPGFGSFAEYGNFGQEGIEVSRFGPVVRDIDADDCRALQAGGGGGGEPKLLQPDDDFLVQRVERRPSSPAPI